MLHKPFFEKIICYFLFKKNLVFQIFIKKRIDNYIEKILNANNCNAYHFTKDAIKTFHFIKKKPLIKNVREIKFVRVVIHQGIMNDIFLYNNDIVFFFSFMFMQKTKKLIFLDKLPENSLSSFSKIFNGTIFSVWENKKYSAKFLYEF